MDEALQVLEKATKNVKTSYLRLAKFTHFLVQQTGSSVTKKILYQFIKKACITVGHQPAMEECSMALVPILQDYVEEIKNQGKIVAAYHKGLREGVHRTQT